jgi:hypothetical protein
MPWNQGRPRRRVSRMGKAVMPEIALQRIYEPAGAADGYRVLVKSSVPRPTLSIRKMGPAGFEPTTKGL